MISYRRFGGAVSDCTCAPISFAVADEVAVVAEDEGAEEIDSKCPVASEVDAEEDAGSAALVIRFWMCCCNGQSTRMISQQRFT